ncbi:MAG: hypothetical protein KDD53_04835, partial [Bdellovibrionales bacterium]|nr:hypothetical protein [Bdellovibrionales bacterium]
MPATGKAGIPLPMDPTPKSESCSRVLCVDLDDTVLLTDMVFESACLLLRQAPLSALMIPLWLTRGRASLKHEIAQRIKINAASLPYNQEVMSFLQEEKANGRRIILATACDQRLANDISSHLGLFEEVIASDGSLNLKGPKKKQVLEERFGENNFDYIG